MSHPKILVLLAAFNGAPWISEQVAGILSQSDVDVDLVISDDGSTDGTRSTVEKLMSDARVRLIAPPIPTGSAAKNFLWLIRQTECMGHEFVSFADQDDIWHSHKLGRACNILKETHASGYSSATVALWPNGGEKLQSVVQTTTESDFLFESAGQGCTYVVTREFYGKLREFLRLPTAPTESLHYHDWAIYALSRAWKLGWAFDPSPAMLYRQHSGNDTGARTSTSGVSKRLALLKNGWYLSQLRAIAGITYAAAPDDALITEWICSLNEPRSLARTWRMAAFCLRGGRRRRVDKVVLLGAVIAGWI